MTEFFSLIDALKKLGYTEATLADRGNALVRLFDLNQTVEHAGLSAAAHAALDSFVGDGVLVASDGALEAMVRVVPFRGFYFVVDSPRRYRHQADRYSYVGGDGVYLTDFVIERVKSGAVATESCLDLCAGSGLMGMALSASFGRVVCTDIHPPAVAWARVNHAINECDNVEVVEGDLYGDIAGPFSVIVANPSYSIFPEDYVKSEEMLPYETGGSQYGLELTMKITEGFDKYLAEGGSAFICTNAPMVHGHDVMTELLQEAFGGRDYAFEIHEVSRVRTRDPEQARFYKQLGIERLDFVVLSARKNRPFSIRRMKLPARARLEHWARFRFADHWAYRQARRILKG